MADVAVTNTFANATTADGNEVNTNFSDLVNYINGRNAGSSAWDSIRVTSASAVPFVANNSSGSSNIANFQDNGTNVLSIADGGATTIAAISGGSSVPLTVNNSTSSGNIAVFQDNGTPAVTILDGGGMTLANDPSGTPAANTLYKGNIVKGWLKFDGTGTIAIADSWNVSGIVDNGVGDYTVTWDRDFANANYAVSITATGSAFGIIESGGNQATGSVRIKTVSDAGADVDRNTVTVMAVGDQ